MKGLNILFKFSITVFFTVIISLILIGRAFAQGGATLPERVNMGLYGGAADDLTYGKTSNRLFAAIQTPGSLFYTDDSCKTWIRAFQEDSLEWMGGQRGWGGGGREIFANDLGWVLVMTQQHGGNLSSAVLSKNDGDSGTYFTLLDPYRFSNFFTIPGPTSVTSIALTNHLALVAMRNYLVRYDGSNLYMLFDISTVSGLSSNYSIMDLAAANTSDTFPIYFIATSAFDGQKGDLYKLNFGTATKITLPSPTLKAQRVFTHFTDNSGDTVIISCIDTLTQTLSAYRSLNGGTSWTNITPSNMTIFTLSDFDYSPDWVSSMPNSNGSRIILPGSAYSDNLGTTWSTYQIVNNSNATHPENPNFIVGSMGKGPVISTNGATGPWISQDNYGLAAVKANKISSSNGVYYLSSNAGLAYTTEYFNHSIAPFDKWNPPYGQFPIPNVGDDAGISAVAVDPTDNQHVIAGYSWGFSVTTTGPAGFTNITPTGWNSGTNYDQMITDIKFLNSDTIFATSGSRLNFAAVNTPIGNVWKSIDGGLTWSNITPSGMSQANCLDVNSLYGATRVYVGCGYRNMNGASVDGSLWRSDDLGINWTKINDGPYSVTGYDSLMPILDVVIDSLALDTIYLAAGENLGHALVISYDGGATYNYTPVSGEGEFTTILQYEPNLLFVANRREIFGYRLNTGSYGLLSRSMPGEFIPDLERGSLLAATSTGLYKIDVSDTTYLSINEHNVNGKLLTARIYPNPTTDDFELEIQLEKSANVQVGIFDATGKLVKAQQEQLSAGKSVLKIKANDLRFGIYYLRARAGDSIFSTKVIKVE